MNELDINNPQLPDFIVPGADEKKQDEPAKIKVIGVGGGGGNAVNHMYHQGIGCVSFVLCNTDAQALRNSPVPVKVQLGAKGEGAGNIPEVAKKLAEESAAEVEALFDDNTRMAFITAGMGGGTGTGAAPVVARIAKEKGVLTVGIVTIPFLFEGEPKILQAFAGVEEMRKHVDALLVINNERLCKIYPDLSWTTAFAKADDSLSNAARSIAELVSKDGKINLDFADVRTTLKDGGAAVISTGSGEGEHRMSRAIQNALTSPLLKESDIYGAERVLFNLYFSPEEGEELRMQESKELSEFMLRFKKKVNVIWGYTHDSSLGKAVKITILATGFEVSDLTFKGEYGGDADEHIAQSQYIVLKPDQLDDNDLLEKLDKTPAYDRPKDFRDNFDGSEKKEESNGSGRRTIRF